MMRHSNKSKAVTSRSRNTSFHDSHVLHLTLTKPVIVGNMSIDGNRQYHSDLSQLKFLNEIPNGYLSLDLNHNINAAMKRTTDDNDEKIILLLRFLLDNHDHLKQQMSKPTFISYRRTLISIMCAAYSTNELIRIAATLFNGSIYLCSLETQTDITRRQSRSQQEEKFCAWGYKFEQYLLSDNPNVPPNIHKPVIENEEFSLYYSATLGNKLLLYGAQIDGLLSTHKAAMSPPKTADVNQNLNYLRKHEYLELKTNRIIQNYKQERNFKRYKLLRCWCQCYLADLRGLLVGFRTDEGIVQDLKWFETQEIVSYCRDEWNPQTAIEFLDYVLSYIQKSFQEESSSDLTTLQFELMGGRIIVKKLGNNNLILPDWFVENIKVAKYLWFNFTILFMYLFKFSKWVKN